MGLPSPPIEGWQERFLAAAENALRSRPMDERIRKLERKALKKVGTKTKVCWISPTAAFARGGSAFEGTPPPSMAGAWPLFHPRSGDAARDSFQVDRSLGFLTVQSCAPLG
jgi:hypothetical protein